MIAARKSGTSHLTHGDCYVHWRLRLLILAPVGGSAEPRMRLAALGRFSSCTDIPMDTAAAAACPPAMAAGAAPAAAEGAANSCWSDGSSRDDTSLEEGNTDVNRPSMDMSGSAWCTLKEHAHPHAPITSQSRDCKKQEFSTHRNTSNAIAVSTVISVPSQSFLPAVCESQFR